MTPEQIIIALDAIEAMNEASRRYRIAAGLPAASVEVPGWVGWLDSSQVKMSAMVEAAQRELWPIPGL